MNIISINDLITLLATIFAFLILFIFWKKNLSLYSKSILSALLSLNLFHSFSNFLEWAEITNLLDPYEDFIQVLKPILWFTLFFAFLQEISEKKLRNSEKKYRESYNRAEFYKDLFAHDINNILQNILSSAELCDIYQENPERVKKVKDIFKIIKNQVVRGSNLVSNIRKLSDLEDSEVLLEKVEMNSVLEELIYDIKNKFNERTMKIEVEKTEAEILIKADNYLRYVFENIILNSIYHNNNPTIEILIKISRFQQRGRNYIKTEFLDNAKGIENSRKESIFRREDTKDQFYYGQGLGLSVVKKIIDNYNGQIWVEDRIPGEYLKGSNFIILIPEA